MVAASRSETSAHKTFPVPVFCEKLSLPLAQATRFQTGPTNRTTGAPSSPSYTKLSPPSKGSSLGQRHTRCSQIAVKAKALSAQSTGVDAWPDARDSSYSTSTVLSKPIYLSRSAPHGCSIVGQMHTGPIPSPGPAYLTDRFSNRPFRWSRLWEPVWQQHHRFLKLCCRSFLRGNRVAITLNRNSVTS